ncbi:CCCH-type zinc finger protein [Trichinella spiralis]|uniref:CCCH-type zinc finger protein n=1 Tax=Trichinella spiralis TaxID=6334 RepID=A0ABR3K8D5_TRISP
MWPKHLHTLRGCQQHNEKTSEVGTQSNMAGMDTNPIGDSARERSRHRTNAQMGGKILRESTKKSDASTAQQNHMVEKRFSGQLQDKESLTSRDVRKMYDRTTDYNLHR